MSYLFLDASENSTTCQYGDKTGFFSRRFATDRNLGACISEVVDNMLQEVGCSFSQIEVLAVCSGPGSLTGLRIASAFFRTLAYIGQKPITAVDLFAWSSQTLQIQGTSGKVKLVLPTLIDKAFVVEADIDKLSCEPASLFARNAISGEHCYSIRCELPGMIRLDPSPEALHEILQNIEATGEFKDILSVLPMYVIPSQAERKLEEKR
jgi:tRNA A37 threonylcarbamoyladenosine modification protein TsaB